MYGSYQIIISRERSIIAGGKKYRIEDNGISVGELANGKTLVIPTSEGFHAISFFAFGKEEKSIQVEVSEQYPIINLSVAINKFSGKVEISYNNYATFHGENKKAKHPILSGIGIILCVLFVWYVVDVLSGNYEPPTDSSRSSNTQMEEFTDSEKADQSLEQASQKFVDGKYMQAINICNEICSNYPNTDAALNMDSYLKEQYDAFQHFSAKELMSEYEENVVNADKEYTGQVLIVSGTISSIDKTSNGRNLCVLLKSDTYFYGVQLNFNSDQEDSVATLSSGQNITVIGKCTGKSGKVFLVIDGENIMIEDCYIIE